MKDSDFEALRERWVVESSESDLGLWWLADDLREVLGDGATEAEVRAATLEALRPLLEAGKLRAVTLLEGGKFEVWTGGVDQQLASIAEGWRAVSTPDIGDVVWFIGERR
jgi:hypothetical protein